VVSILLGGTLTYRSLSVELFPEIEFPLVTVSTYYPSSNPDAVVRNVTEPIEKAISGVQGLESIQSSSFENRSVILASFKFGTDMREAELTIISNLNGISFPPGVDEPAVVRINPDTFPVIQLSVLGDREAIEVQEFVESLVVPAISSVDGVLRIELTGLVDHQVHVTVNTVRLSDFGISMLQLSRVLRENNVTLPGGSITQGSQTFPIRTTNSYNSLEQLQNLPIGLTSFQPSPDNPENQVLLSDIAEITLGMGTGSSVSRTNGSPSIGVSVLKDPEANTVDVTNRVLESLASLNGLPTDIEIVTITNDGPEIQSQLDHLLREALVGFLFAIGVVFMFLITIRPNLLKGVQLTLRPTLVIGLSIPLSILTGILLMGTQGMSLNMMTLGGLAISVGRVVDDSIVVLENVYRHIQRGEDRFQAALEATREVAPAIFASTLTTIAVFVPLAFIQGLVGSFFLPFALTVCFALSASFLVALTAVPVLGALLLRPNVSDPDKTLSISDMTGTYTTSDDSHSWTQKVYKHALVWSLRHKAVTLLASALLTVGSLSLIILIPVTLFPSGGERFVSIDVQLPPGSSVEKIFDQVDDVENVLAGLLDEGIAETYQTTVGSLNNPFSSGSNSGRPSSANILLRLSENSPAGMADILRRDLSGTGRSVVVTEIADGPPQSELEVKVTGGDYTAISGVAVDLARDFESIEGIVNVSSDVSEARPEIVIVVNPVVSGFLGLTATSVAAQVNQIFAGRPITQIDLNGDSVGVVLKLSQDDSSSIDKVKSIIITGPSGSANLGDLAEVSFKPSPVSISRFDGQRAASIIGSITDNDTQKIGQKVQAKIDAMNLPPGVKVTTGGVFQQIAEGFRDIFSAMAIGVLLVYLVMIISLGSLKSPFVIITSLPLALIGALIALAITGRTLGLPAAMGLLLLIGIVVTNAIVLIAFVEQLRERGLNIHDALVQGGLVRLRPILMTAFTTSFALIPLAVFASEEGGIIGAELATVVMGGLASSTFLTLIVVPVVYTLVHSSLPRVFRIVRSNSS
jgi:HAE1 family hydrophobic/amphiphilic exporter-1